jgi:hypothetical protein
VFSSQQVSDAPTGFVNSLRVTVSTAATPSAGQYVFCRQIIEGFNIADLGWGTASAQTVTASFWVKSSITGAYAVFFINSAEDRSYFSTVTVNSANTWEFKTVTVPGDTTGTWLTNNSNGIRFGVDLGSGSNYQGTVNAWQSGWRQRSAGTVNFCQNTGATFYITGVQLEAGSVASPFERRDYGRELIMCQRYYQLLQYSYGTSLGTNSIARCTWPLKVTMRANMTIAVVGTPNWFYGGGTANYSSLSTNYSIPEMAQVDMNVTGGSSASGTMCSSSSGGSSYFTASAEL